MLHRPWPTLADGEDSVALTTEDAGWDWAGLRVVLLHPGVPRTIETGPYEAFILPLAGSLSVAVGGVTFELAGRLSVFEKVTDFCYVGRDSSLVLHSVEGAEVALPMARCEQKLPAKYGPADGVPIETRGAGPATRQVTNFGVPGVWDHAEKLIACELLTPPGNWSSYPPHKHDATEGCTVVNEEIYYYRIAGADQITPSRSGFGIHHTYTGLEHEEAGLQKIELEATVRDRDVVLVPHGYHGPCIAAPGYPMYYLNVLAGPGADRSTAFCDDPAHHWVRDSWEGQAPDSRVPMTSA